MNEAQWGTISLEDLELHEILEDFKSGSPVTGMVIGCGAGGGKRILEAIQVRNGWV